LKVLQVLNVVALTDDLPGRGLCRGQVGTIVEALAPGVFEVEFSDNNGRRCDSLALRAEQLMVLHHQPRDTRPTDPDMPRASRAPE